MIKLTQNVRGSEFGQDKRLRRPTVQIETQDEGVDRIQVHTGRGRRERGKQCERVNFWCTVAVRRRGWDDRMRQHFQSGRNFGWMLAEERRRLHLQARVPCVADISYDLHDHSLRVDGQEPHGRVLRGSSEDHQLRGTARSSLSKIVLKLQKSRRCTPLASNIHGMENDIDDVEESVRATERFSRSLLYENELNSV
ncbi:hypothetical protein E2986_11801 [Frieseomelitta varia]|uniref:Uncharacterized protein n=1 Tax=Frieseomelitta varia TaxID=561572 RepID=A0A833W9I7_9HYME|nr:hypothetical protein E2986_11801 [Frieseomelitta varia]